MPPVPKDILPSNSPAINPFYPGVLKNIPPNTDGLLEIESDGSQLISLVGGKAVFRDETGYRTLSVGDPIYLGQITDIDPLEGRVFARLNKGGIIDEVEVLLHSEDSYRRAIGGTRLTPSSNW